MTNLTPADLAALAQAERGRTESSKQAARVIWRIDQGVPRSAAQLAQVLATHGIHLGENSVRRLRYVARLLHTLDPGRLDPDAVRDVNDLEYLYRLQRAAEVARVSVPDLLAQLERDAPADPRAYLAAIIKARDAQATPESKEAWKSPLPRVPLSVANDLNRAFGSWVKARDLTAQLGVQELTVLLRGERHAAVLAAPLLEWAAHVGVDPARADEALACALRTLPPHHWRTLLVAVGAPGLDPG